MKSSAPREYAAQPGFTSAPNFCLVGYASSWLMRMKRLPQTNRGSVMFVNCHRMIGRAAANDWPGPGPCGTKGSCGTMTVPPGAITESAHGANLAAHGPRL